MIVFFPCYSIESLSLDRASGEANELFSCWSAMFHPALIEKFAKLPRWENASMPLSEMPYEIILVPPCCESLIEQSWFETMLEKPVIIIRGLSDRDEIVAELLRRTGVENHGFDAPFVADCLALGTGYLLTELITRQIRYMSILDTSMLYSKLNEAITAFRKKEIDNITTSLQRAFELLTQSKEYCFPSQAHLVDMILVAPNTPGDSLRQMLRSQNSSNVLLPGATLLALAENDPKCLSELRQSVQEGKTSIIGDDLGERPLFMLPIAEIADRLLAGIETYKKLLGKRPLVFGRAGAGLTPVLPQLLKLAGFSGAIPYAPIDGLEPTKEKQSKIQWVSRDGSKLGALARYPMNAADRDLLLTLARNFGQAMNNDTTTTIVFARYPNQDAKWLDDLRRMDTYSTVLGKFTRLDEYFENTRYSGIEKEYGFGDFKTNRLSRDVREGRSDPVSSWVKYYGLCAAKTSFSVLRMLIATASKTLPGFLREGTSGNPIVGSGIAYENLLANRLFDPVESSRVDPESQDESNLLANIEKFKKMLALHLGAAITGCSFESLDSLPQEEAGGLLVLNPLPFARTAIFDVTHFSYLPGITATVLFAREFECPGGKRKEIILEVPPLGYAWVGPGSEEKIVTPHETKPAGWLQNVKKMFSGTKPREEPKLVEKIVEPIAKNRSKEVVIMRNEYFEAKIDVMTGVLQSVFTYDVRGNRFSQQPALRMNQGERAGDSRDTADMNRGYTILAADRVDVESPGPLSGCVRIEGRMMKPDGNLAAEFVQRYRIRRGGRIIETELEIDAKTEPGDAPWDSYYCFRNVWADPGLEVVGGMHDSSVRLETELMQTPLFVDLRYEKRGITLLCGGLPYHRHVDERRLDSLLMTKGEIARKFRIGIAIDADSPLQAALDFYEPPYSIPAPSPKITSAWLYHIGARNVNLLRCETILTSGDGGGTDLGGGGVRLWLLESTGKETLCPIRSFKAPASAYKTDLEGNRLVSCEIVADRIMLPMRPGELVLLDIRFA